MAPPDLNHVVDVLVNRARQQGFVCPQDIRAELEKANLAATPWEEIIDLAGQALVLHEGRYYPAGGASPVVRRQQRIERTLRRLIRRYRSTAAREERRRQDRIELIRPVEVWAEDGRVLTLLSRNLSRTGLCLISAQSLLGEKIHVLLPGPDGEEPYHFLARIVWAFMVGDGLFENGGVFLHVFPRGTAHLRLAQLD
jgi:hypothetical protein